MVSVKEKADALLHEDKGRAQFIRFVINGIFASAVQYVVYVLLQYVIEVNVAFAIGYLVSFAVNFYTTCIFTFRQRPTWKRFVGVSGSHAVNFCMQQLLFWCCMQLAVNRFVAPIIVMGIAMLIQFTILRFVFRKK